MNKKLKRINKLISKFYKENNQMLYITTAEAFENKNYSFDIILTDKKSKRYWKFLFEIVTLSFFENNINTTIRTYMSEQKWHFNSVIVDWAYKPLYDMQTNTFILKKFGNITEEDIYNCTLYFVEKVLDNWLIWNIRIDFPKKEEKNEY